MNSGRPEEDAAGYAPADRRVSPPDPKRFRIRGDLPQVMRLSRKALAAIGVTAGLAIGGALIYALQPQSHDAPENLVAPDNSRRPGPLLAAPADYGKMSGSASPLPGDLVASNGPAPDDGAFVPLPPVEQPASLPPPDPAIAAEQQELRIAGQEAGNARTSGLFLGTQTNGKETAAAPAAPTQPASFLSPRQGKETTSAGRIQLPVSARILQAGSVIPAALVTGVRSDLPGQIIAQVTQNVYDSPTGQILLIPQGARLIGEYDSEIASGQNRLLLAWDRLILPGGRSILLDRLPGADPSGKAGLADRTDYHWSGILKAALISTLLGAGTEIVTNDQSDIARALRSGTQDTVSETGRQLVERELKIAPTLTIRPGFALRIIVTRDIVFEEAGAP